MARTTNLDSLPVDQFREFVSYVIAALISGVGLLCTLGTEFGALALLVFCSTFGGAVGARGGRSLAGVTLGLAGLLLGLVLAGFLLPAVQAAR